MGGDIDGDNETVVRYRVSYDSITKSIGEGASVNYVAYAVYLMKEDGSYELIASYAPVKFIDGNADCEMILAKNQSYKIAFVAQHYSDDGTQPTYPVDFVAQTVSMPDSPAANSEDYDLFHTIDEIIDYDGNQPDEIILDRIVALVNFQCSLDNWNAAVSAGKQPAYSDVSITDVPESYSLLTGEFSAAKETVSYSKSQITENHILAYAYCLPAGSAEVTFKLYLTDDDNNPQIITSADIPVEKNKITNITGVLIY